jgi:hypothetical protein
MLGTTIIKRKHAIHEGARNGSKQASCALADQKKKKIGVPSTKGDTDRTHRAGIVIVGRERIDRGAQNLAGRLVVDPAGGSGGRPAPPHLPVASEAKQSGAISEAGGKIIGGRGKRGEEWHARWPRRGGGGEAGELAPRSESGRRGGSGDGRNWEELLALKYNRAGNGGG